MTTARRKEDGTLGILLAGGAGYVGSVLAPKIHSLRRD